VVAKQLCPAKESTVGSRKKAPQVCRFLKYFFTGIKFTVQCKKQPKPFPIELVSRKNFKFSLYSNSDGVFFVRVGKNTLYLFVGKLLVSTERMKIEKCLFLQKVVV
jgi:hypothetical protein